MAKQTASASVDDILRIVQLITADTQAELMNPSHYVLELWSYLFCVSDSQEGLDSLAKLFPLNTRVRLVQHEPSPFKFATAGRGFSAGSLNNLVYSKAGHTQDPRFVTIPTQDLPPAVVSSPTVITNPYIYGDNYVGGTLILNAGVYDGDEPLVYMYQWLKDGFDIPSATANTYTLVSGDESKVVSCRVNVSNAYGNIDTYSNQMLIEATIPAPSPMVTDANLHDHFTSEIATGPTEPATNISRIRFNSDGTLDYMQDTTVLETLPYLVTTGAGAGNDYKVIYSVVDGTQLSGLNQNAAAPLSSAVTVSLSVTGTNALKTGTYNFTIFKASDPSISESKTIVISTSVSL